MALMAPPPAGLRPDALATNQQSQSQSGNITSADAALTQLVQTWPEYQAYMHMLSQPGIHPDLAALRQALMQRIQTLHVPDTSTFDPYTGQFRESSWQEQHPALSAGLITAGIAGAGLGGAALTGGIGASGAAGGLGGVEAGAASGIAPETVGIGTTGIGAGGSVLGAGGAAANSAFDADGNFVGNSAFPQDTSGGIFGPGSVLSKILKAAIPASALIAGKALSPAPFTPQMAGTGGTGTSAAGSPELQQLLQEAVRRASSQGPLFDATTRQALAGLPTYAQSKGGV